MWNENQRTINSPAGMMDVSSPRSHQLPAHPPLERPAPPCYNARRDRSALRGGRAVAAGAVSGAAAGVGRAAGAGGRLALPALGMAVALVAALRPRPALPAHR